VLRHRGRPAQSILTLTFISLAIAATLFSPAFNAAIGLPASGTSTIDAMARTAVVAAALGAQILLLLLVGRRATLSRRGWQRGVVASVTVGAMWVLFGATSGVPATTRQVDSWTEASFLLVFLAFLGFALVDVIRAACRWAPATKGALRCGLRMIALGCQCGLGYVAVKAAVLGGLLVRAPLPFAFEAAAGRSLAVAGGALVMLGAAMPTVASLIGRGQRWVGVYRRHVALYPLWADLVDVVPDVALSRPRSRLTDRLNVIGMDRRLYRRVIEILDGRLSLRQYIVAVDEVTDDPGPPYADARAAREASVLRAAVVAARRGVRPERPAWTAGAGAATLEEEVVWLSRVTRHYTLQSYGYLFTCGRTGPWRGSVQASGPSLSHRLPTPGGVALIWPAWAGRRPRSGERLKRGLRSLK